MIGRVMAGFKLPAVINLSGYAWGNENRVSQFDTSKEMYDTTFTLVAGDDGSYVLRDKNGIAILRPRRRRVSGANTADGPIAPARRQAGRPARRAFRTAARLDAEHRGPFAKGLVVQETTLQSGVIRASLEGGDAGLTAAIVNSMAREFVRQDVESVRPKPSTCWPSSTSNCRACARNSTTRSSATTSSANARHGRSGRRKPPAAATDRRQQDQAARSAAATRGDVAALHGESPGSGGARCADRSVARRGGP